MTGLQAAALLQHATADLELSHQVLKQYAIQQIDMTTRVYREYDLFDELVNGSLRGYVTYDWIEYKSHGGFIANAVVPEIECELWEKAYADESARYETTFILSGHILLDRPDLFEEELRTEVCKKYGMTREEARARTAAIIQRETEKALRKPYV